MPDLDGDGPWVSTHRGNNRTYHTDPDCQYLRAAGNVRELADGEKDRLSECRACSGEDRRGRGSRNRGHYQAALEAASDGD